MIIKYNGDPNSPLEISHCANFENCSIVMSKEFEIYSYQSALEVINFLCSCTDPITIFSQIAWAFQKYPSIKEIMNLIDVTTAKVVKAAIRTEVKKEYYKKQDNWKLEPVSL